MAAVRTPSRKDPTTPSRKDPTTPFRVSRQALLYRLKRIGVVDEEQLQTLLLAPTRDAAQRRGYDVSLYENGNEGLVIGDYSSLATDLFEKGRISEGHYNELMNVLVNA